jgi:hypothetical protein
VEGAESGDTGALSEAPMVFISPESPVRESQVHGAPDHGMYGALRAGFAHCGIDSSGYMTWINADDILMPGALSCVAKLFRELAEVRSTGQTRVSKWAKSS